MSVTSPDQRPVGGNVRITVPLARLPVAITALLDVLSIHVYLVMAHPAVVIGHITGRNSFVNVLVDGLVKGTYINQCRLCHRIRSSVIRTVAFNTGIATGKRDVVRVASVAGCALFSSIMIYARVACPAYSCVQGLEGLHIVLTIMA